MSDFVNEILPALGGLNYDDDRKFLPPNDGLDRNNIAISGYGENGVVVNVYGNRQITLPALISEYNAGTGYKLGDMVYVEDAPDYYSYKLIVDSSTGNAPSGTTTDNAYWEFIYLYEGANIESKVIGSCKDNNTNSVFIFIENSVKAHSIFRFNLADESVDKILYQEPNLEFSNKTIRHKAEEFDGKLVWNDGYDRDDNGISAPKKINIDLAYNYANYPKTYIGDSVTTGNKRRIGDTIYQSGFTLASITDLTGLDGRKEDVTTADGTWTYVDDSYADITDLEINLIKQPPVLSLKYIYLIDSDRGSTNFRNVFWRFSYQYEYYDSERSAVSPWTDWTVHSNDVETASGSTDDYAYNYVSIQFNTGNTKEVKKVRIFGESSDTIGTWKVIKEINMFSNDNQEVYTLSDALTSVTRLDSETDYSIRFYNDTAYNFIDSDVATRLFDNVPFYAGAMNVLDNRIVLSDVTTGYDNINLDVDTTVFSVASPIGSQFNIGTDALSQTVLVDDTLTVTLDITTGSFDDDIAKYGVVTLEQDSNITIDGGAIGSIWLTGGEEALFTAEKYSNNEDILLQLRDQISRHLTKYIDTAKATIVTAPYLIGTTQISFVLQATSGNYFNLAEYADISTFVAAYNAYTLNSVNTKNYNGSSLKTGANHPFSLEYRDKFGRTNGSNAENQINVYIPEKVRIDDALTPPALYGFELPFIEMTINHAPPTWAESCYLTYTGNVNYEKVIQFVVTDRQELDLEGTGTNDYFAMRLPPSVDYQFQKGDVVRLHGVSPNAELTNDYQFPFNEYDILRSASNEEILQVLNSTTVQEISDLRYRVTGEGIIYGAETENFKGESFTPVGVEQDVLREYARSIGEILNPFNSKRILDSYIESQRQENLQEAQRELAQKFKQQPGGWIIFRKNVLAQADVEQFDTLVEIVRKKQSVSSGIYKEFIEIPLYESGGVKYHTGDQDQTAVLPAIIKFSKGDIWLKKQDYGGLVVNPIYEEIYMERDVVSDFTPSKINNLGRTVISVTDVERVRSQDVLFSNKIIPSTFTNGLNTFPASNVINLNSEYGKCKDIEKRGDLVNFIQEYRISTANFGQGGFNAGLQLREQSLNYGSCFSTLQTEKYIYGFDIIQGVFWRLATNGLYPISGKSSLGEYQYDYKMFKYFKDKSEALLNSGIENIDVRIGYDYRNELIIVTFIDYNNSSNNETLAFSEGTNRWISFFDFVGEHYENKNNVFMSFKDGGLWVHDDTATRCNFYGTQYKMSVDINSNDKQNIIKRFNAISVHSTKDFSVPDINIPFSSKYGSMASKLDSNRFRNKEGVYYSTYLRNINTDTSKPDNYNLLQGERLRGYTIINTIEYDTTVSATEIELYKVDVSSSFSKV